MNDVPRVHRNDWSRIAVPDLEHLAAHADGQRGHSRLREPGEARPHPRLAQPADVPRPNCSRWSSSTTAASRRCGCPASGRSAPGSSGPKTGWGRANALHTGAAESTGEILHWLDSDMVVFPDHVAAQARWHHAVPYAVTLGYKRFVEQPTWPTPEAVVEGVGEGRCRRSVRRPRGRAARLRRGVHRPHRSAPHRRPPGLPDPRRCHGGAAPRAVRGRRRPRPAPAARRGHRVRVPPRPGRRGVRARAGRPQLASGREPRHAPGRRRPAVQPAVPRRPHAVPTLVRKAGGAWRGAAGRGGDGGGRRAGRAGARRGRRRAARRPSRTYGWSWSAPGTSCTTTRRDGARRPAARPAADRRGVPRRPAGPAGHRGAHRRVPGRRTCWSCRSRTGCPGRR